MISTLPDPSTLAIGILLVGVLAGCMDDGGADCVDGVCTELSRPGDAFAANTTDAVRPSAVWEGCRGAFLTHYLPSDLVQPHLPEGFETIGVFGAPLADVRLLAVDCPRADIAARTVEPFRYLLVGAFTVPSNRSWTADDMDATFLYEVFVSDEAAGERLARWGLPVTSASFEIERHQVGAAVRDAWTVTATDRSYAFSVTVVGDETGPSRLPYVYWAGDGPFTRVDANISREFTTGVIGASDVVMTGNAKLAEILGADAAPFAMQPHLSFGEEWRLYPFPFSPS